MAKRQRAGNNCPKLAWTPTMDETLLDAYLEQLHQGNCIDGTFTGMAYDNIVAEVNSKLNKNLTKDNIKSRWRNLKTNFAKPFDIFKNGMSGFTWKSDQKMWEAEPEVWDKLIEAHPDAARWMNKPIPYYDKMLILYGKDRATGDHAETSREMRARQISKPTKGTVESIEGIDLLISQNEATLENFESLDDDFVHIVDNPEDHSQPSQEANSSKSKKSKQSKSQKEVISIVEAISDVAGAIRQGNEFFRDAFQHLPMKEGELYNQLIELEVEEKYLSDIYIFLVEHPDKVRAMLGTPLQARKTILMKMVFGSSGPTY